MFERFRSRFTGRSQRPGDGASQAEATAAGAADQGGSTPAPDDAALDDAALDAAREAVTAARDAAWRGVGTVDTDVLAPMINPAFTGGPRWPGFRQAFRRVSLAGGVGLVASDGLADPFDDGGPSTGYGCEVYLASTAFASGELAVVNRTWQFTALHTVAQNVAGNAVALGPMLERHGGVISMGLPDSDAPPDWRDADGMAGVIIGVGLPGVPASVAVGDEDVLLVGLVPLRPDELALVVEGGDDARQRIAQALRGSNAAELASAERRSVLPLP